MPLSKLSDTLTQEIKIFLLFPTLRLGCAFTWRFRLRKSSKYIVEAKKDSLGLSLINCTPGLALIKVFCSYLTAVLAQVSVTNCFIYFLQLPKLHTYFHVCLLDGMARIFSYLLCHNRDSTHVSSVAPL